MPASFLWGRSHFCRRWLCVRNAIHVHRSLSLGLHSRRRHCSRGDRVRHRPALLTAPGVHVAVVTLGLHLVMPTLLMRGRDFGTGGWYGLSNIPPLRVSAPLGLVSIYYVALGMFFLLLFFMDKIIHSSIGLAFVALREAEQFAESLGVNQYKYKLMVFSMSAFLTGVMGAFYAHYISKITPAILNLDLFLLVLVMVVLGGKGRFPGAVIGAFVLTVLNEVLRAAEIYRVLVLGLIIVLTMIYMPNGLMGSFELVTHSIERRLKKSRISKLAT